MNNFNDWEDVLAMNGLREAVLAYAKAEAPEYLEESPEGLIVIGEDDYPYVLQQAIKEKGECVFWFSSGVDEQVQDQVHYRFAGKYFECDGNGQIGGPYDDNNAEDFLDLLNHMTCQVNDNADAPRDCMSMGGEFPDEYFINLCRNIPGVGGRIKINGNSYVRTTAGLVRKE
jgi:hypothetical protein